MKHRLSILIMVLMMVLPLSSYAQQRLVQGVVLDNLGEPLIGAGVMVQGTRTGTTTDIDGKFSLQASPKDKLVVSFLGYQDVVIEAASTNLKVVLQPDSNFIEETIVVGYGARKKATVTGAISAVNNKEIAVTKNENVVNMLSGKIPGVRITQNSSQPGELTVFLVTKLTSHVWTPMRSIMCPSSRTPRLPSMVCVPPTVSSL